VKIVKWTGLQVPGDTGIPFACPQFADKSIQLVGSFYGATVVIEGSNMADSNSPTYFILRDSGGNALSFSSPDGKSIDENTYWVRPRVVSGGDTRYTSIDVYLLVETPR